MRYVTSGVGLAGVILLLGCNNAPHRRDSVGTAGPAPTGETSSTVLVSYLNNNAQRVQGLTALEVAIDCKQDGSPVPGLQGKLFCQKPRSFRLTGTVVSQPAVDVGSNEQEFWYWIRENKPPYVFHCSYQDLNRRQIAMPFPFQPEMIMEALGIAEYNPADTYRVESRGKTLELVHSTTTPQGMPVQKVTVFANGPTAVQAGRPQVLAHILKDGQGHEICRATISEVQVDRATGAVLPRRVQLVWPAQKIEMRMKLDDVHVAPITGPRAETLFSRRNLRYETYDLAQGRKDDPSGQVQRTGGYAYP
jgi:hypothetical protein